MRATIGTEVLRTDDGATIAYESVGEGPAIVLVHGHPFDMSMWDEQIEPLVSAGWRVIRFDLRGYGRSSVSPAVTTLAAFARDLAALADAQRLGPVVLVGLSMGGQIVMEFHRLFPDRVAGLVFADTTADAESAQGKRARRLQADSLMRDGMYPYASDVLAKMLAPTTIELNPRAAGHVLRMMLSTPAEGAAAALRARAERVDYRASLATCTVPALVICGTEDSFTPPADAEALSAAIPGSVLEFIQEVAHMPNIEAPTRFNELLTRFVGRVRERMA